MKGHRPSFQSIHSFTEFCQYYWYREELAGICKKLGIEHNGTKKELNSYIEQYFKGNKIPHQPATTPRRKALNPSETISLNSSLLKSGFALNDRFRHFFAEQIGATHFKFTADMATAWRKVKQTHDISFTIQDMLEVYYKHSSYAKYDSSSCQWNKFLKDFCADVENNIFKNKLKAAATLWNRVRDSALPKVYSHKLIEVYGSFLEEYKQ